MGQCHACLCLCYVEYVIHGLNVVSLIFWQAFLPKCGYDDYKVRSYAKQGTRMVYIPRLCLTEQEGVLKWMRDLEVRCYPLFSSIHPESKVTA